MIEQLVIFLGNLWAGILSAGVTFCAILFPYYWMYDEYDNSGRHLSAWWFVLTVIVAAIVARWVGYRVYYNYRNAMDEFQAKAMLETAKREAAEIMKTKYNSNTNINI